MNFGTKASIIASKSCDNWLCYRFTDTEAKDIEIFGMMPYKPKHLIPTANPAADPSQRQASRHSVFACEWTCRAHLHDPFRVQRQKETARKQLIQRQKGPVKWRTRVCSRPNDIRSKSALALWSRYYTENVNVSAGSLQFSRIIVQ